MIAGSRHFLLTENVPVGSLSAIEFVGIIAGGTELCFGRFFRMGF
jgi:hypothetical protein